MTRTAQEFEWVETNFGSQLSLRADGTVFGKVESWEDALLAYTRVQGEMKYLDQFWSEEDAKIAVETAIGIELTPR